MEENDGYKRDRPRKRKDEDTREMDVMGAESAE
mgnify:CR=1 FL=1